MIEIKDLIYFIELSKTLNFHEAAKNCQITQPTLSAQIKGLEKKLGLELFHRTKRTVKLSPYGHHLLKKAKQVILSHTSFTQHAKHLITKSSIKCGIDTCIAPSIKVKIIKYLISENIPIKENTAKKLEKELENLNLDLIISTHILNKKPIDHIKIKKDPFYVILPKNHYLSQFKESKQNLLLAEPLLILERFRESAPYIWLKKNKKSKDLNSIDTLESLIELTKSTKWISLLPKSYINELPNNFRALPIKNNPWSYSINIKFMSQSLQIDQFKEIANYIHRLYSEQPSLSPGKSESLSRESPQTAKFLANSDMFDMP